MFIFNFTIKHIYFSLTVKTGLKKDRSNVMEEARINGWEERSKAHWHINGIDCGISMYLKHRAYKIESISSKQQQPIKILAIQVAGCGRRKTKYINGENVTQ